MAGFFNKKKHRAVIPRWRLFEVTTRLGELSNVHDRVRARRDDVSIADLVRDFKENQTVWHAADLMSAAFVGGHDADGREAAEFIMAHAADAAPPAVDLAKKMLHGFPSPEPQILPWDAVVHAERKQLINYNWDATRWCDLGLAHTVRGNKISAIRCLIVATQLAPTNRFIVRSALRCFMHWGEPDRAQSIVRKALEHSNDPWLVSAEIAAATARGRPPKNVAEARLLVGDRSIQPHHISELATALASLEIENGSRRRAKVLIGRGLEDPTENSVAQFEWMLTERKIDTPLVDFMEGVPRLFEAKAQDRFSAGDWAEALLYAHKWYEDQPFSSRPADMASYSASLLQQYDVAVKYLTSAIRSNPCDPVLINNLAYFQAMDDQLEQAIETFGLLNGLELSDENRLVTQATRGLLAIRSGDVELGRQFYRDTMEEARAKRLLEMRILATLNFAREEKRLGNHVEAVSLFEMARSDAKKNTDKEVETMLKITETAIKREREAVAQ